MARDFLIATAVIPKTGECPGYRPEHASTALAWVPAAVSSMESVTGQSVDLLALPAGYFAIDSYSPSAMQELAEAVFDAGVKVTLATTVDAYDFGPSRRHLKLSYGVVMLGRSILGRPVQQTSWTGAEGRAVRREDAQEEFRVHSVGGLRVGLLCCGEIFSPVVKEVLSNLAPRVVINTAHRAMEDKGGLKGTWLRYLRQVSDEIDGWALFAGASYDPHGADYNYYSGGQASAVHQVRVPLVNVTLRCFSVSA
ncbi:MAG: hypothetical protein ACHRXM_07875 [Isosphaerales bacterium]